MFLSFLRFQSFLHSIIFGKISVDVAKTFEEDAFQTVVKTHSDTVRVTAMVQ